MKTGNGLFSTQKSRNLLKRQAHHWKIVSRKQPISGFHGCTFGLNFILKCLLFCCKHSAITLSVKFDSYQWKKSNFRSTLGARQDIFLSLFSLSNFWGPCWISEESNHKLALKAKKTVLRRWKIFKIFFRKLWLFDSFYIVDQIFS